MNRILAVALLLVVGSFVAACGPKRSQAIGEPVTLPSGGPSSQAARPPARSTGGPSGVVGRVFMEGGPISLSAPSTPRPWPNKAIRVTDSSGKVVAKARTSRSGWFAVTLEPGGYRIRTSDAWPVGFVVRTGTVTHLTINIPVP
jgi:hypothetical protein